MQIVLAILIGLGATAVLLGLGLLFATWAVYWANALIEQPTYIALTVMMLPIIAMLVAAFSFIAWQEIR